MGRGVSKKQTTVDRDEGGFERNMNVRFEKNDFYFLIIIYFLSNVNVMFEYSVLDIIRLECKVYPSPPVYIHTPFAYIISLSEKHVWFL